MGSKFSKFIGMVMVLTMLFMAGGFTIYLFEEASNQGFELVLLGLAAMMGIGWLLFRGPVGKAIATMLEGTARVDPGVSMRVEDLEDRLAELSLETQRLMEIEDRLDFTERLLAQHTDPGSLPRGEQG